MNLVKPRSQSTQIQIQNILSENVCKLLPAGSVARQAPPKKSDSFGKPPRRTRIEPGRLRWCCRPDQLGDLRET